MNDMEQDDQFVREAIEKAGKRPAVSPVASDGIARAAREAWEKRQKAAASRRSPYLLPVAAALVIAVVGIWWALRPQPASPPAIAAYVARVWGTVDVVPGQPLRVGTVLEVPDGNARVALGIDGGQSLRLDAGTRVKLISPMIAQLDQGAVYVDSPPGSRYHVTIRTVAGDFTPVGTQFQVQAPRGAPLVSLKVREGTVSLIRDGRGVAAHAGEQLIVSRDGAITRSEVSANDAGWAWVVEAAPMPEIEGRTFRTFLDWIARENGWKLKFADEQAAKLSETIVLHGSIAQLTPEQALQSLTLSSGFNYRVEKGTLLVGLRPSSAG